MTKQSRHYFFVYFTPTGVHHGLLTAVQIKTPPGPKEDKMVTAAEKAVKALVGLWRDRGVITSEELRQAPVIVALALSREAAMKAARGLIEKRSGNATHQEMYAAGVGWLAKSLRGEVFGLFHDAVTEIHAALGIGISLELQAMIDALRLTSMVKQGTLQPGDLAKAIEIAALDNDNAYVTDSDQAVGYLSDQSRLTCRNYRFGLGGLRLIYKEEGKEAFGLLARHLLILSGAPSTKETLSDLVELMGTVIRERGSVVLSLPSGPEDVLMVRTTGGVFRVVVSRVDRVK